MTQAFTDCTCPPGLAEATGAHHPGCQLASIGANVVCPPGSDCCQQDHDHDAAASACPGGHEGAACPEPGSCPVWASATADARHPAYSGEAPGDCPGGHCHKDVDGCTVCRPLIITAAGSAAQISGVGA
jgi:hypothetical protein